MSDELPLGSRPEVPQTNVGLTAYCRCDHQLDQHSLTELDVGYDPAKDGDEYKLKWRFHCSGVWTFAKGHTSRCTCQNFIPRP